MSVESIIEAFNRLSSVEQCEFVDFILGRSESSARSVSQFLGELRKKNGLFCPRCGCVEEVNRFGYAKNGAQRYRCRACGRTFVATTGTIVSRTKKSLRQWKLFFQCMERGLSCRNTAKICGIHYTTAFRWRHAVLDVVRNEEHPEGLEGIVEADETFFRLSFKGARRIKEVAGRYAHKRGGAVSMRGLSKEQVCVPSVLSRNGVAFAKAGCLGSVSVEGLSYALGNTLASGSTVCTDSARAYKKYSEDRGIVHIHLKGKATRTGIYNLQSINGFHSGLKVFMARFQGVSTKYLNNYLAWNASLRNNRSDGSGFSGHLMDVSFGNIGKMNSKGYMKRSAIPVVNPEAFRRKAA